MLRLYFEKVCSHISVDVHLHHWCLASCGHFSTSHGASGVCSLLGLVLALINGRKASCCSFLMLGYTHSALWPLQSQTSLILTLMSSWLSLNFCPEEIWWGKAGRTQLTWFALALSWLLMITNHMLCSDREYCQVMRNSKLLDIKQVKYPSFSSLKIKIWTYIWNYYQNDLPNLKYY